MALAALNNEFRGYLLIFKWTILSFGVQLRHDYSTEHAVITLLQVKKNETQEQLPGKSSASCAKMLHANACRDQYATADVTTVEMSSLPLKAVGKKTARFPKHWQLWEPNFKCN